MKVECSQRGHLPNDLRKHPEGDDNEKISLEGGELLKELGIFEFYRLEYRYAMFDSILLDRTLVHLESTSAGLVGHRYDSDYIVSFFDEGVQRCDSELRSSHVNYSFFAEDAHYLGF